MSDRLSFDQKPIPHQRFSEGVFCGDGVIGAHPCHLEHSLLRANGGLLCRRWRERSEGHRRLSGYADLQSET